MEENLNESKPSVWSVGLKYGIILAFASIAFTLIRIVLNDNPYQSDWKSWASAIISIVIVVLAHKNFKDSGNGFMTYGQGLGLSMVVVLVSIVIGGIFSYVYTNLVDTTVMDAVYEKMAQDMEEKGQGKEQIAMAVEWTKKLFWPFYFIGGVIMGFIIGVIVSIFTQKTNPEPTF